MRRMLKDNQRLSKVLTPLRRKKKRSPLRMTKPLPKKRSKRKPLQSLRSGQNYPQRRPHCPNSNTAEIRMVSTPTTNTSFT